MSNTTPYALHMKPLNQHDGKERRLWFLRRTEDIAPSTSGAKLPTDWQIAMAQKLQHSGYSVNPRQAAEIIGTLSSKAQGFTPRQTDETIEQIHAALTST